MLGLVRRTPLEDPNSQFIITLAFKEITTLVNEIQDAGFKSVEFDASNLASGVYLYRLQSGTFVDTKKFVVIK